jgi:hypothetical protein
MAMLNHGAVHFLDDQREIGEQKLLDLLRPVALKLSDACVHKRGVLGVQRVALDRQADRAAHCLGCGRLGGIYVARQASITSL